MFHFPHSSNSKSLPYSLYQTVAWACRRDIDSCLINPIGTLWAKPTENPDDLDADSDDSDAVRDDLDAIRDDSDASHDDSGAVRDASDAINNNLDAVRLRRFRRCSQHFRRRSQCFRSSIVGDSSGRRLRFSSRRFWRRFSSQRFQWCVMGIFYFLFFISFPFELIFLLIFV